MGEDGIVFAIRCETRRGEGGRQQDTAHQNDSVSFSFIADSLPYFIEHKMDLPPQALSLREAS